jgi:hypothetical protein
MSQPVIYTSVARSSRRNRNCSRSQGGYRPTLAESESFSEAAAKDLPGGFKIRAVESYLFFAGHLR